MTYHCDPEGNSVDIVLDIDGQAHVITIPTSEVERIYTTLRAAEYGTTVPAHDLGDDK